jgi:hypothetical protein
MGDTPTRGHAGPRKKLVHIIVGREGKVGSVLPSFLTEAIILIAVDTISIIERTVPCWSLVIPKSLVRRWLGYTHQGEEADCWMLEL